MKNYILACSTIFWALATNGQSKTFNDKANDYIQQYASWAIEEQQRVGIPAAITLAQGIYETGAGESELATQANNHFGIKCKKEWQGATFAHTDDAPNECFRKYNSAKESYLDHSNYLKNSLRYSELFTYHPTNYVAWAKGLKRCGYATNPTYAHKLIKMIEDFNLQQYTLAASGARVNEIVPTQEPTTPQVQETVAANAVKPESNEIVQYNGLKAIYCHKGDNLLEKAMKYHIRYAKLLEINELPDQALAGDRYIYLENKKTKGTHVSYRVQEGETIEMIAHKEGMSSRQLRIYNLMAQNEQAVAGSILKLQSQSDERPETYKMNAEERTKHEQRFRLVSEQQKNSNSDFILTNNKAEQTPVKTKEPIIAAQAAADNKEELSFGYGAEAPAAIKEVVPKGEAEIPSTNTQVQEAVLEPAATTIEKQDEEPKDELALLKARLDKAVYSGAPKSNIKVSSSDESNSIDSPEPQKAVFHTVKKGETAYEIAKKYSISVKQLNQWNDLNFDGIKVGQKLRIK